MQNNTPLVRIVDDDEGIRNSMAFLLEGEGWEVKPIATVLNFLPVTISPVQAASFLMFVCQI